MKENIGKVSLSALRLDWVDGSGESETRGKMISQEALLEAETRDLNYGVIIRQTQYLLVIYIRQTRQRENKRQRGNSHLSDLDIQL